jgi:hypothetical protein
MVKLNDSDIVDQIEIIRSNNNRLWMQLVRLALTSAPEEAKRILRQIKNNDMQVSTWMDQL